MDRQPGPQNHRVSPDHLVGDVQRCSAAADARETFRSSAVHLESFIRF